MTKNGFVPERPGVGWVHLSTDSRSGKGVSKTDTQAREKCRTLDAHALTRAVDVDSVVERLFDNVSVMEGRRRIVFTGNHSERAVAELRKRVHTNFVAVVDDAS